MPPIFIEGKPLPRAETPPKWIWLEPLGPEEELVYRKPPQISASQAAPSREAAKSGDELSGSEHFSEDESSSFDEYSDEERPRSRIQPRAEAMRMSADQGEYGRRRLTEDDVEIFKKWKLAHPGQSYPSEKEKARLMRQTGLTDIRQLRNWFYKNKSLQDVSSVEKPRNSPLPQESRDVLVDWVQAHRAHPYPTREEKDQLMREADITDKQLRNWFDYYRRKSFFH